MTPVAPPPHKASRLGIKAGIALIGAAVLVAVIAGVLSWRLLAGEVEVVPADGQPHDLALAADRTYGVWLTPGRPATCELSDPDGRPVSLGPVDGTYEVNQWDADRSFESGSGVLTVTCTPGSALADTDVRLGPLPSIPALLGLILGGVCLGMVLGGSGLVLIIVTVVRRRRPAPGWHPGPAQ